MWCPHLLAASDSHLGSRGSSVSGPDTIDPSLSNTAPQSPPLHLTGSHAKGTHILWRRSYLPFSGERLLPRKEGRGFIPNTLLGTGQRPPWCGCKIHLASRGRTPMPASGVTTWAMALGDHHRETCTTVQWAGRSASSAA